LRLAVYSDFAYRRHADRVYAEQAFVVFLLGLNDYVQHLVLVGRLDPAPQPWHFPLPESAEYHALPHYPKLSKPLKVFTALGASAGRFWHTLEEIDAVWLFGPNPLAIVFAVLAKIRGRQVTLGVRQDYASYVRSRHPNRPLLRLAAVVLDRAFRLLARTCAVVVVGPRLAEHYAHAQRLEVLSVTLISESDLIPDPDSAAASPGEDLVVLSVGRLDNEKNPLLLADVLASLNDGARGWQLNVCGDGPLEQRLGDRLVALKVAEHAQLLGFVPIGPELHHIYRNSDFFLHTSLTEGVPQVLFEAFAAGLPLVATDVGAVADTVGDAALLVPPDSPQAAVAALRRLATDPALRARLVKAGLEIARAHTREAQCRQVVEFLEKGSSLHTPSRWTVP
jgi:glycosyltransferase involved in cell wall biosynthesis